MGQFDEFVEGMHKAGNAMSAAISAQVTREAQERLAVEAAKIAEK